MTIHQGQDRLPDTLLEPVTPPITAPSGTPAQPLQLPFGLTHDDLRSAPGVLVRAFAPVLAALTVVIAIASASSLPDDFSGSPSDWLRSAVVVTALAMGGRLVADGSIAAEVASAEVGAALRLIPLVVTVAIVVLAARAAARDERATPSSTTTHLLARSGLAALVAGVVATVVAGIAGTSSAYGVDLAEELDIAGSVGVGAGLFGTFVGATLVVGVAVLLGRLVAAPDGVVPAVVTALRTPERHGELRSVLRILRTFAVGMLAAAALAVVAGYLYAAVFTDDLDGYRLGALAGLLVLGVNLVVVTVLGALGVPGVVSTESRGSADVMEFFEDSIGSASGTSTGLTDHKWLLLVLLVPAAIALGTAIRTALREPVATVLGTSALKTAALAGAVAGLTAALLVRVSGSAEASAAGAFDFLEFAGSAGMSAGPSLLWAPVLGAAWSAAVVWAVRFGPTLALSVHPRVARLVAGRRIAPVWADALTGTVPAPAGRRSVAVRRSALATAVLIAVAAMGAVVVALLNALVFTPQAAAEEYLGAVADGDAAAVLSQLADAPDPDGQPLLGEDVLGSDDFVAISDVEFGEVSEYGSSATVAVTYTVDGEEVQDSISLTAGEDRFGLFRTWTVAEQLPTVELYASNGLDQQIAGETLAAGSYGALPGRYTVHAADHPLLTADPTPVLVTSDTYATVSPVADVKPDAVAAARKAVDAALADCTGSTSLPLDNCPFFTSDYWGDDLSGIEVAVTKAPKYTLEYDASIGGLEIVSQAYGEVRLTGTQTYETFASWFSGTEEPELRPYDQRYSFTLSGEVTATGRGMDVTLRD
jgi:hypothetical protein